MRREIHSAILSMPALLPYRQSLSRQRQPWRRPRAPGLRALQRLLGRRMNSVQHFTDWWEAVKDNPDPFR